MTRTLTPGAGCRWEFGSRVHFEIDGARGMEKLGRHQLAKPTDYALKLVQSAIASGARTVNVASQPGRFVVWPGGQPPAPDERCNLPAFLLSGQEAGRHALAAPRRRAVQLLS